MQANYLQARDFLLCYRGSEATFNAYRREVERLFQWCWFIRHAELKTLRRNDIEDYIQFCQNPPLNWISNKQVPRFINKEDQRLPNPNWRPFVSIDNKNQYSVSQKALQASFAILNSFFNFLLQGEHVEINPFNQIRQKSKYFRKFQGKEPVRRLSELQWETVIEEAKKLADKDPKKHERTLFIMSALYSLYLRISELAASPRWIPQMNHFKRDSENNWWFTTVGKGNKERDISVCDAMLSALIRYRRHLGLGDHPSFRENTPLLPRERGKGPLSDTRQIRRIVQTCFDSAILTLQSEGHVEEAQQLNDATVHWLRHTGISDDVKRRPREHVRDDAGHGSSAITDKYIDVERLARHRSGRKKTIDPNEVKD